MGAIVDSGWRVRPLPADEAARARATDVLAQAFRDDELARYVEADPAKRGLTCRAFFDTLLAAVPPDAVHVVGDPIAGVAIWLPSASSGDEEGDLLRALSLPDPAHVERFHLAIGALDRVHRAAFVEPHLYLIFLGVHPDAQGSGAGTALMTELHAEADATGLACALEAFGEPNHVFYRRRGYEVVSASTVHFSDEVVRSMRRGPQVPASAVALDGGSPAPGSSGSRVLGHGRSPFVLALSSTFLRPDTRRSPFSARLRFHGCFAR